MFKRQDSGGRFRKIAKERTFAPPPRLRSLELSIFNSPPLFTWAVIMSSESKCLARSNKSTDAGKATKKRTRQNGIGDLWTGNSTFRFEF